MSAVYEWHIVVRRKNTYGTAVVSSTPAVILGSNRNEVTEKVRAAFGAEYDGFRRLWSHDWTLTEMREVPPAS